MKALGYFLLSALFLLWLSAGSGLAQSGFSGRVVEVVDGKTVVIELHTKSRITAQLQFIEVPEPEQELHRVVIDHLKTLVLGKPVSFKPRGITTEKSIVQLFSDGVDISRQMIRDGAAWHAVLEKSGQDADERAVYESTEERARSERRGVWGRAGMLPAWEFRVAREEQKKLEERARLEEIKRRAREEAARRTPELPETPELKMDFNSGMWEKLIRPEKDLENVSPTSNGLLSGRVPHLRVGYLATLPTPVELRGKDLPEKFEMLTYYLYKEYEDPDPAAYLLAFLSRAGEWRFAEKNTLTVFADKRQIPLGPAVRVFRTNAGKSEELLMYQTDRAALEKIIRAKTVRLVIGDYTSRKGGSALQKSLPELLEMTNY